MKNSKKILILLVLPLLFLSACKKDERPTLDDRIGTADELSVSYEGVLGALEKLDVYQQGTHQLDTKREGVIILQSRIIDLNKYLDEEVLVSGRMITGVDAQKPVLSVVEINYVDESRNVEGEEYENKSLGFRFTHPGNWLLTEASQSIRLAFQEEDVVDITVFSDKENLDDLVALEEESQPNEVTIGAQRALRISTDMRLAFYVPNPPKNKVYRLEYRSTSDLESEDDAVAQRDLFYDLLESFELIYITQASGDKCGGLQQLECAEDHICQLEDGSKYAEGTCMAIGGEASAGSCPFIAPPAACSEYRISEYTSKGCPTRYECLTEGNATDPAAFRDLNVVSAGINPDENTQDGAISEEEDEPAEEEVEEDESGDNEEPTEEVEYEVPEDLSFNYENARQEFSLNIPKTWYWNNFGFIDGDYTVGFAEGEMEEPGDELIRLRLADSDGGDASKKIDDTYYIFSGPSDLQGVMDEMASSTEKTEE